MNNPFGDEKLTEVFIWDKKLVKTGLAYVPADKRKHIDAQRVEENKTELEKLKKQRLERERQREEMDKEKEFLQRVKEAEYYREWEKQEDSVRLPSRRADENSTLSKFRCNSETFRNSSRVVDTGIFADLPPSKIRCNFEMFRNYIVISAVSNFQFRNSDWRISRELSPPPFLSSTFSHFRLVSLQSSSSPFENPHHRRSSEAHRSSRPLHQRRRRRSRRGNARTVDLPERTDHS